MGSSRIKASLLNFKIINLLGLLSAFIFLLLILIYAPELVPYNKNTSLKVSQGTNLQELKDLAQNLDSRLRFAYEAVWNFTRIVVVFLLAVIVLFGINLLIARKLKKASAAVE